MKQNYAVTLTTLVALAPTRAIINPAVAIMAFNISQSVLVNLQIGSAPSIEGHGISTASSSTICRHSAVLNEKAKPQIAHATSKVPAAILKMFFAELLLGGRLLCLDSHGLPIFAQLCSPPA
ncbi:MAG: hypothetical protein L0287_06765 [Anaerolineae bacterium]|nr:hypothetical protein [Anaerolineae bacterium]